MGDVTWRPSQGRGGDSEGGSRAEHPGLQEGPFSRTWRSWVYCEDSERLYTHIYAHSI